MTSRALRQRLRLYGATVSREGSTLRVAGGNGSPAVEYRVALDGTISRRTLPEGWRYLVSCWEQGQGVLALWLTEPIRLGGGPPVTGATGGEWANATEYAALVRAGLRGLGFRGSVRRGRGTAYAWVEIRGTEPDGGFSPGDSALLSRIGIAPGGNLALVAPERSVRVAVLAAIQGSRP